MRRIMIVPLALLLAAPLAWGQAEKGKDPPKADKASSPQDELKTLQDEQTKARDALIKTYQETKDTKVQGEIRDKFFKMQLDYAGKYLELAKKNSKDAVALDALQQVLGVMGMPGSEKIVGEAIDALANDHAKSERMKLVCQMLQRSSSPSVEKLMLAVMEKNMDHTTQGHACMALALNFKNRFKEASDAEADKLRKQAEKYFGLVSEKYADVKGQRGDSLADSAKSQLATMKNMVNAAVGKSVPDLQGPDLDGKQFKIGDYRGKVVLLDFWAHW